MGPPIMITVHRSTRPILTHYARDDDDSLAVVADWCEQCARSDRD